MKKVFLLIASAFLMVPAFAQNVTTSEDKTTRTIVEETITPEGKIVTTTVYQKNSVFTNGFWRNWTLSGNLGAQLFYGDNDWKVNKMTEMVTFPAVDVYLTKWASPSFGVGIGISYGKFKGLLLISNVRLKQMLMDGLPLTNFIPTLLANMSMRSLLISVAVGLTPMSSPTPISATSSSATIPTASLTSTLSAAAV